MTGTIFENTHLDLRMWLYTINAVIISRNGISAMQFQCELSVSHQIAWCMLKLIHEAMSKDELAEFSGIVEMDETYIGSNKNIIMMTDYFR